MADRKPVDLSGMAALAVHHYGHMLDEGARHLPYFFAKLGREESYAWHSEWDFGDACGRFLDALILCGTLLGDRRGRQAEEKMKDALRWMQSDADGLFYRKDNEWDVALGANMFDQRSAFLGLLSWYLIDKEPEAKVRIDRLIRGMADIGVRRDDYICYPFETYAQGMAVPEAIYTEHGFVVDPAHYGGGVFILPLAIYYERTKDHEAGLLLGMLTRFVVHHSEAYEEDGSFWSKARYPDDGHFHSKMGTVAGILRYAAIVQDRELIGWCRKVYHWALGMGGSYGWFPEGTGLNGQEPVDERYRWLPGTIKHSETCCTTDMIHTAMYLAKNVDASYWDHAEKFANGLAAAQLRDVSWMKTVTDKPDTPSRTYRNVPERYRGGFTGRMNPNDFTNNGKVDTMACCCGAGGRGLYLLWDHATECRGNRLYVHMWFAKENDAVGVDVRLGTDNGEPADAAAGSLRVVVKQGGDLYVRIPEWLSFPDLQIAGEQDQSRGGGCERDGAYAVVRGLQADEAVRFTFPVREVERVETIAGDPYTLSWIGNRWTGIDPSGAHIPLPGV